MEKGRAGSVIYLNFSKVFDTASQYAWNQVRTLWYGWVDNQIDKKAIGWWGSESSG